MGRFLCYKVEWEKKHSKVKENTYSLMPLYKMTMWQCRMRNTVNDIVITMHGARRVLDLLG